MDKILKVIKNKWFLLGVSFLSFIYVIILFNITVNTFAYYLEIKNFNAMMVMYVFVHFVFATIMFFTRKQIPTIISALIIPILTFALMIVGFGKWYLIVPPLVVSAVIFLSCGAGEACKTVMGTLLLIMFVVGAAAYNIMCEYLNINLYYAVTDIFTSQDQDIDFSSRNNDYLITSDGRYRLVRYIEPKKNTQITSYYIEEAFKDKSYPFVVCRRVLGSKRVLVTTNNREVSPEWKDDVTLYIDGMTISVPEFLSEKDEPEETEETKASQTSIASTALQSSDTDVSVITEA